MSSVSVAWHLGVGVVLTGMLLLVPARTSRGQATEMVEGFSGSYRFSRSAQETAALRAELDRVADQIGWFIRGVARSRLHDEIRPPPRIDFTAVGGALRVRIGDRTPLTCDGSRQPIVGDNDESGTATCTRRGDRIVVRSVFPDAVMTDELTLSADGRRLRLRVTVAAEALPDTIRFQLTYRRR